MNLVSNKETGEAWVHVRFDVDGRVWAQRTDGKWSEVSKNFDDPAALAVMFVREEMGDDARRSILTSQISKIMASKKEALGKTAPSDDAKLPAADGGVKRKGEVVKSSSTDVSQKNTPAAEDSAKEPSKKEGSAGERKAFGKSRCSKETRRYFRRQGDHHRSAESRNRQDTACTGGHHTRSTFPERELREGRTIIDKKEEYHGKELL